MCAHRITAATVVRGHLLARGAEQQSCAVPRMVAPVVAVSALCARFLRRLMARLQGVHRGRSVCWGVHVSGGAR